MRVAYVTETWPPELNGVSLTVERTVRFLRDQGHQVELIRPRQRNEARRDDDEEWRTDGLPLPIYPDLRCGVARPATLTRRFERTRPDLVHVVTQGPLGRAALLAAERNGLPLTTDFRTSFHEYSHYYRLGWISPLICRYLRDFHNRAARTFVPSRRVLHELEAAGFQRLELLGGGVDTDLFSPAKRSRELRAAWGILDDEQWVLLYVGRLARGKNVELALRTFECLRYLRPNTCLVVVGDGPMRRRLEAEFPAARFVGTQCGEALARHYASADLFVIPSQSETFGNVTLEAMASGLAVIGFDTAAVAEHIVHGRNGIAVAPGDETAFIRQVCGSAALGASRLAPLRRQAREAALNANWDKVLREFEQHLAETACVRLAEAPRHVVLA